MKKMFEVIRHLNGNAIREVRSAGVSKPNVTVRKNVGSVVVLIRRNVKEMKPAA